MCFPVEIEEFLRTPILKDICKVLLLKPVHPPGLPFLTIYLWLKLVHMF